MRRAHIIDVSSRKRVLRTDDVTCVEALEAVPFTEKSEITSAQREGALFGPHQCAPFEKIVRIVGTGGTSGQPTRIGWTSSDAELYNQMGARALWTNGCRPGDFVVNCFNYSLYAGGIMDHMAFETLGAGILPYGVGRSERLLDLLSGLPAARDSRILCALRNALLCRSSARDRTSTRARSEIAQHSQGDIFGRTRAADTWLSREARRGVGHGRERPVRSRRSGCAERRM